MIDIGQHYIVGFNGKSYNDELEELIVKYRVGGLIFFKRNIPESRSDLKKMISQIKSKAKEQNIPEPFISIDHEGGRVHRLGSLATHFPSPYKMELLNDNDLFKVYAQQGSELAFFGFNMVFAPVLDLCPKTSEGAIGDRAFGADFKTAIPRIFTSQKGLEESGLITVPKHFPGHGDVGIDPHYNLPNVEKGLDEFEDSDLLPFKKLIERDAKAIMSAHILTSKIDSTFPATISKFWLDYLREKLLFSGVIISDDLCMKALWDNYSIEEITKIGITAGLDSLCICFNDGEFKDAFKKSYEYLTNIAKENDAFAKPIKESSARIKDLKKRLSGLKQFDDELLFVRGSQLLKEIFEKCLD